MIKFPDSGLAKAQGLYQFVRFLTDVGQSADVSDVFDGSGEPPVEKESDPEDKDHQVGKGHLRKYIRRGARSDSVCRPRLVHRDLFVLLRWLLGLEDGGAERSCPELSAAPQVYLGPEHAAGKSLICHLFKFSSSTVFDNGIELVPI